MNSSHSFRSIGKTLQHLFSFPICSSTYRPQSCFGILPTHPNWTCRRAFIPSSIHFKKKKKIKFVPPLNEADLVEQFVRGSGPGGQAVNKTNNAVSLIHQPTGIRVQAHTHRSREANRNQARRVLAERVDFFVNRGQSQIEKMWRTEQRRKLAKIRKRKKKEKEEELNMRKRDGNMMGGLDEQNRRMYSPLKRNHEAQSPIPRTFPPANLIDRNNL